MNSVSFDIYDILKDDIDNDTILRIGTELYNDDDKTYISIYDTGGGEQNPKFAIDDYLFQIKSTSKEYNVAFDKLTKIKLKLEGIQPFTTNDIFYLGIWTMSNIAFIHHNKHNMSVFTCNFKTTRQYLNTQDSGNRTILN